MGLMSSTSAKTSEIGLGVSLIFPKRVATWVAAVRADDFGQAVGGLMERYLKGIC